MGWLCNLLYLSLSDKKQCKSVFCGLVNAKKYRNELRNEVLNLMVIFSNIKTEVGPSLKLIIIEYPSSNPCYTAIVPRFRELCAVCRKVYCSISLLMFLWDKVRWHI